MMRYRIFAALTVLFCIFTMAFAFCGRVPTAACSRQRPEAREYNDCTPPENTGYKAEVKKMLVSIKRLNMSEDEVFRTLLKEYGEDKAGEIYKIVEKMYR